MTPLFETEMNNSDRLEQIIDPRFHMLAQRNKIFPRSKETTATSLADMRLSSQAWTSPEDKIQAPIIELKQSSRLSFISKTGRQICSVRCSIIVIATLLFLLCALAIALSLGLIYGLANGSSCSTSTTTAITRTTSITTSTTTSTSTTTTTTSTTTTSATTSTTTTTTTPPATAWIPSNYGTPCSSTCINVTTVTPSTLVAS
ncbi:unnamed protein product [Rotaria sp. Silwood1]|nr:unnamed protein product [Rotaria sp. Silwood1]CAF5032359.1 unnamed protein product [Rotaria sp. Silwood1]